MRITHEKSKIKVTIEATEHEIQEIIRILDECDVVNDNEDEDFCDCGLEDCTACFPVYSKLKNAFEISIGRASTIKRKFKTKRRKSIRNQETDDL